MQTLSASVPALLLALLAISCAGKSEIMDDTGVKKDLPSGIQDFPPPGEGIPKIGTNCQPVNTKILYTNPEARSAKLPRIAWSNNQYGVLWEQEVKVGSTLKNHVAFMRVSKEGEPQGEATFLTQDPTVPLYSSVVMTGLEKGFAVVWTDNREAGKYDLYLLTLDENGQTTAAEKKITSSGKVHYPSLVHPTFIDIEGTRPVDSLVVAWRDSRNLKDPPYPGGPQSGRSDIFFKVMSPSGEDKVAEVRVTTDASKTDPLWPEMAYDGSHYALVWRDGTYDRIYFTYLNEDGSVVVPEQEVATKVGSLGTGADIVWATNEFGIAYGANQAATTGEIKFARIRRDNGEIVGAQTVRNVGRPCSPSVSYNGERYGLAWQTDCGKTGSQLVFALVDDGGNPLKPDGTSCFGSTDPDCGLVTISPDAEGCHSYSEMISVGGKFAIVWMNAPEHRIYFSQIVCTP